jgi:hypothetical protein
MLKFMKLVPPWVWVSLGAIVVTTGVGVGAWIYQRAVLNTLASVKEQIFERVVWMKETNLAFEKEQIKIDGTFKGKMQANDEEWK